MPTAENEFAKQKKKKQQQKRQTFRCAQENCLDFCVAGEILRCFGALGETVAACDNNINSQKENVFVLIFMRAALLHVVLWAWLPSKQPASPYAYNKIIMQTKATAKAEQTDAEQEEESEKERWAGKGARPQPQTSVSAAASAVAASFY